MAAGSVPHGATIIQGGGGGGFKTLVDIDFAVQTPGVVADGLVTYSGQKLYKVNSASSTTHAIVAGTGYSATLAGGLIGNATLSCDGFFLRYADLPSLPDSPSSRFRVWLRYSNAFGAGADRIGIIVGNMATIGAPAVAQLAAGFQIESGATESFYLYNSNVGGDLVNNAPSANDVFVAETDGTVLIGYNQTGNWGATWPATSALELNGARNPAGIYTVAFANIPAFTDPSWGVYIFGKGAAFTFKNLRIDVAN